MDTISARVAGYEHGLRNPYPTFDFELDRVIATLYGDAPVPSDIEAAFYQGIRDSKMPDESEYCGPFAAAATKGVDVRTLYTILRDDERRNKLFPRAIAEGEGTRRTWHIHFEDLAAWKPSAAGRPRKKSG